MSFKIISYFCDVDPGDTYYSDHAKMFMKNMDSLGMDYHVEEIYSMGSYRDNCLFKPRFILKCIEKFNCSVLWLDIDSYVHKKLDMFENIDSDIIFATNSIDENGNFIPKASPVFINKTENGYNFIKKWNEKCDYYLNNDKKFFDHEIMLEVLKEEKLEIALFGYRFCLFADSNHPEPDPVITMGISSGPSKNQGLRDMGHNNQLIKGNSTRQTYYTVNGKIK